LFCRKSGQRPEALGVVLMICIFHDTKIRAHTLYTKSNLH
jgi:hypothetical protein